MIIFLPRKYNCTRNASDVRLVRASFVELGLLSFLSARPLHSLMRVAADLHRVFSRLSLHQVSRSEQVLQDDFIVRAPLLRCVALCGTKATLRPLADERCGVVAM